MSVSPHNFRRQWGGGMAHWAFWAMRISHRPKQYKKSEDSESIEDTSLFTDFKTQ